LQASGPRLATFPARDVAFAMYVQKCWSELDAKQRDDPRELQHLVRRWHTRALVVPQSPLAALRQGSLWYVFRDGRGGGVPPEREWWTAPGTACVTFDADLVITNADDAACALAGVQPGGLLGRRWSDLVPTQARALGTAWLKEALSRGEAISSVFDLPLPDGGYRVIEYRAEPRYVTYWRELTVLPPEPASEA
jgi:PAS domain-containing protein